MKIPGENCAAKAPVTRTMTTTLRLGILLAASVTCANAQWLNYPDPDTPRTKDGKPDMTAKVPRTYSGKPDLSGVWAVEPPQAW